MNDVKIITLSYSLFIAVGVSILLIALLKILLNDWDFMLLLALLMYVAVPFVIALCLMAITAVALAFHVRTDSILLLLGITTTIYTLFTASYFFIESLAEDNYIVEVVSIFYALLCLGSFARSRLWVSRA